MTGPLAPQFTQVRDSFEKLRLAGRTSDILKVWCDDGMDALSVIERHVQDMEKALGLIASTSGKGVALKLSEARTIARAALSAREKEEETNG